MTKSHRSLPVGRTVLVSVVLASLGGLAVGASPARAAAPVCAGPANICIDSFTVSPASVPNDRDSPVTVSVHVSSGTPGCVKLSQANGLNNEVDVTLDLTQTTPTSGTWTAGFVAKARNRPGTYVSNSLHFCNGGDIDSDQLRSLGPAAALTVTGTNDTDAPALRSLSVTPTSADATLGDVTFAVTARVTDGFAGTTDVGLNVAPATPLPGNPDLVTYFVLSRTAGTDLDGTWTGQLKLPAGSSTTWALEVNTGDFMKNLGSVGSAALAARGLPGSVTTRTTAAPPVPANLRAVSTVAAFGDAPNGAHFVNIVGTARPAGKPVATAWLVTIPAGCGQLWSTTPGSAAVRGGSAGWKLCTYGVTAVNQFGASKTTTVTALI